MTFHNGNLNTACQSQAHNPSQLITADWDDRSGVILTSYRIEDRLERLRTVHHAIRAFAPDTANKVGRLHDHKGMLSIFWVVRPAFKDRQLYEIVWGSSIALELEEHVEHLLYEAHKI